MRVALLSGSKGLGPGVTPPAPSCAAPPGETGAGDREVEKRLSPVYPWDHMCAAARH